MNYAETLPQSERMGNKEREGFWSRSWTDNRVAAVCILYLLLILLFYAWALFDTWIGRNFIPTTIIGYSGEKLNGSAFRLVMYAVLGGALGGTINGLRSVLNYFLAFRKEHFWKYVAYPWLGATNALFVLVLINSGLAVFGGGELNNPGQLVTMFAVGILAGYGSRDVFLWLDAQVSRLFTYDVTAPNLIGLTLPEARVELQKDRLELGEVNVTPAYDPDKNYIITAQEPKAGESIPCKSAMSVTIKEKMPTQ